MLIKMSVLDDAYDKDKDTILVCLGKLFKVATIQKEEIIILMLKSEFKNKYMMKVLPNFNKNIKFPLPGTILQLTMVKVLLMELMEFGQDITPNLQFSL